jgi:hypothetical protein
MNYLVAAADGPFYLFIDRTAKPGEPSRAGQSPRGAVSPRDWDAVRETLTLLSIPGMRDSIRKRAVKSSRNA